MLCYVVVFLKFAGSVVLDDVLDDEEIENMDTAMKRKSDAYQIMVYIRDFRT